MGRKYRKQKKRGANYVIKEKEVPMSKRQKDDESHEKANQQKRSDGDSKEIAVAVDTQNQINASPILKLNAICCDDLFDWLSSDDLHSLGQTCKRMKQLTGVYFRENFNSELCCWNPFTGSPPYIFAPFVRSIFFSFLSQKKDFQYAGMYCDSPREIAFGGAKLDKSRIGYIKAKLDKIETIKLINPDMPSSFNLYDDLLKFCPNLKILVLSIKENIAKYDKWLCHKFPKLEHFQFDYDGSASLSRIFEKFFQKNPHLHCFETEPRFLLDNSDAFINPNAIKLDVLFIQFELIGREMDDFMDVYMLLKKLNDNGQKYKLDVSWWGRPIAQDQINRIGSLRGLEKLSVEFKKDLVFPKIISLEVIKISTHRSLENIYLERIAASFPNLYRVYLNSSLEYQMLPFLRLLPKLKEIRLSYNLNEPQFEGYNLRALNEERKKLSGACKVTIYVCEMYYLETKMAPKNLYTNHDLIELKRSEFVENTLPEL